MLSGVEASLYYQKVITRKTYFLLNYVKKPLKYFRGFVFIQIKFSVRHSNLFFLYFSSL